MHVYHELFDMLDFAERNEDLSTVEAPTSPFCQRQVAHKIPIIFGLCMLVVLFLYACLGPLVMLCKPV